jgi:hypothetical protein
VKGQDVHALHVSTAEPVVKEWRNPMSPEARADRTSASGTPLPRLTRSPNGLFAPSVVVGSGSESDTPYPWKVRLMTSICCSRVRRTKFTA